MRKISKPLLILLLAVGAFGLRVVLPEPAIESNQELECKVAARYAGPFGIFTREERVSPILRYDGHAPKSLPDVDCTQVFKRGGINIEPRPCPPLKGDLACNEYEIWLSRVVKVQEAKEGYTLLVTHTCHITDDICAYGGSIEIHRKLGWWVLGVEVPTWIS